MQIVEIGLLFSNTMLDSIVFLSWEKMHVHVLGPGSIGLLHSFHLAKCKIPLTLLKRPLPCKTADLVSKEASISILEPGTIARSSPVTCFVEPSSNLDNNDGGIARPIDHLIVTTKAFDAVGAIQSIAHRLHSRSVMLLLSNGALRVYDDIMDQIYSRKGKRPSILLGLTTHGAVKADEHQSSAFYNVTHTGLGSTVIGPATPLDSSDNRPEVQVFKDVLEHCWQGPLSYSYENDSQKVKLALISKLGVNCALNPLAGLLQCQNGGLLTSESIEIMNEICHEIELVYPELTVKGQLLKSALQVAQDTRENTNSMLVDLRKESSKRTEIDFLNGYIVEKARKAGIPVPNNTLLTNLIKAKQQL